MSCTRCVGRTRKGTICLRFASCHKPGCSQYCWQHATKYSKVKGCRNNSVRPEAKNQNRGKWEQYISTQQEKKQPVTLGICHSRKYPKLSRSGKLIFFIDVGGEADISDDLFNQANSTKFDKVFGGSKSAGVVDTILFVSCPLFVFFSGGLQNFETLPQRSWLLPALARLLRPGGEIIYTNLLQFRRNNKKQIEKEAEAVGLHATFPKVSDLGENWQLQIGADREITVLTKS